MKTQTKISRLQSLCKQSFLPAVYADRMTGAMEYALGETNRRRKLQVAFNTAHHITPKTIQKKIHDITESMKSAHDKAVFANVLLDQKIFAKDPKRLIKLKEKEMQKVVKVLDFETAALLRDEIRTLEGSVEKKKIIK